MPVPRAGNIPGANLPPDGCHSPLTKMGLLGQALAALPTPTRFLCLEHPLPSRPPEQELRSAPVPPQRSPSVHGARHTADEKGWQMHLQSNSQLRNPSPMWVPAGQGAGAPSLRRLSPQGDASTGQLLRVSGLFHFAFLSLEAGVLSRTKHELYALQWVDFDSRRGGVGLRKTALEVLPISSGIWAQG